VLEAGATFDLREGADGKKWDFLKSEDRARARLLVSNEKPFIVIGSPPCTDFCSLNERLNYKKMSGAEIRRRKVEANILLDFALEVYEQKTLPPRAPGDSDHLGCPTDDGFMPEEGRWGGGESFVPVRVADLLGERRSTSAEADSLSESGSGSAAALVEAVSARTCPPATIGG
jgi:hypothetical protein